jgi:hypothetical protein
MSSALRGDRSTARATPAATAFAEPARERAQGEAASGGSKL